MLTRILAAALLAAAIVSGGAVAFLRTDYVANNLCEFAVASIEEATGAKVQLARCSVQPESGRLTIEGLKARDPDGRIELSVERIFAQVKVRPLLQKVELVRLEVDYPELRLALDKGKPETPEDAGQCLPAVLDRFELGRVQVRKARVDISAGGVRVRLPRATVHVKGDGQVLQAKVALRGGSIALPGRTIGLVSVHAKGGIDLHGAGSVNLDKADLLGTEATAFVKGTLSDFCHPHIDALANVEVGDLQLATARLLPGVLSGVGGALSVDAHAVITPSRVQVKGDLGIKALALEGFAPGDAKLHFSVTPQAVQIDQLHIPFSRGELAGSAQLELSSSLPISADLSLRELELPELLHKLGIEGSLVTLRATGKVLAKGTLAPLRLAGDGNLDVADFAVVDQPIRCGTKKCELRPRTERMFEFPRGHLATRVMVDPDKVQLKDTVIDAGDSRVLAEATFQTDLRKGMQIVAHSQAAWLDDFKSHIGPLPADGMLVFNARVGGPYSALKIEGQARAEDARLLDLKLGSVATQVSFDVPTMKLTLEQIEGKKDRSTYRGHLSLALGSPLHEIDAHLELPDAYLHDLVDLAEGLVPKLASVDDPIDVDGHLRGVLDAHGPVQSPDAVATLSFDRVSLWGESFDHGSGHLTLHGQEPRLSIDELHLFHGEASIAMAGRFGPAWQLDMDAKSEHFDLAELDQARRAKLTGPMLASAHIGGVAGHPLISSSVQFQGGKAGRALLGDGDFSLTVDGEEMRWKGAVGTHTLQGEAALRGTFPYTTTASVRIPELHKYLELSWPQAELQSGALTAQIEAHGSLLKWRESSGVVTVTQLQLEKSDLKFENDGPSHISFGPEGVRIDQLALRAPYTTAQLSGKRAADGKLELRLAASIDGRLLPALFPDIEHAGGTYLLQATVAGTAQAPTVLGNLRIEDGAGSLRGVPVLARGWNGSLSFSQDALVIDSLAGKLDSGEARLSGGLELHDLQPSKVDLQAHLSDVDMKLRDDLSGAFDGDLTLLGSPLEPTLGGSVIVSRMKYTEDLDIERSLLDFSRRPPAPKVLTKSALLVHYDLDVHLSRGVRVENNLARTDLKGDLKVTGTSRSLGLLGSVNTVHGTAQFRGNEFAIEQGVLSFNDRQRIRPSFDLQATATVKEYKVRLHAFGTPADPHLTLGSDPALAEADLGFLLTFGFVSANLQQASFSANDAGLAIGVEALNKVTGFSDEVRRFIPKNAILRDPNIDFASDFSVATNRLEPMARFSSHLVTDRLDLKVLEGLTTRRYRGVISYQLSDALSTRLQLDNEHIYNGVDTDFGVDLHYKWEGE